MLELFTNPIMANAVIIFGGICALALCTAIMGHDYPSRTESPMQRAIRRLREGVDH